MNSEPTDSGPPSDRVDSDVTRRVAGHVDGGAIRVAMVSEHASPLAVLGGVDAGGQNVHVAELARALARRGHRVEVYTRRDAPGLPERVALAPGVDVVHVDAGPARELPKDSLLPWMGAFAAELADRWSEPGGRPDVVHSHFWMSGLAALDAGAVAGTPVVATFHALGAVKRRHQGCDDTSPPQRLAVEADLARQVDLVVATCRDEVAELRQMVGRRALRERVRVVPCGVDTAHFTPSPAAGEPVLAPALAARRQPHRLVTVSRLVARKGVETAVRALAALPDTELLVAGGPPAATLHRDAEAQRLIALAQALGVADRVRLLGRIPHDLLPPLLRSADVVVATPWYEPFGIVPLEAMACGRPVVGSAVGGLLDTVADGVTGTLVPPRDAPALAAAVAPLLTDPARAQAWGRAGRARAVRSYSWERVAQATEAAYRHVLARTPLAEAALEPIAQPQEAL